MQHSACVCVCVCAHARVCVYVCVSVFVCCWLLTELGDVVAGRVAGEQQGAGELGRMGPSVEQPEAAVGAHLGGGIPHYLHHAAVEPPRGEGRGWRHCSGTNE